MRIFQITIVRVSALCVLLISVGCAPVNPKPFQDYEVSTRRVQDGIESVFLIDRQMTTEGFTQKLVEGNTKSFSDLSVCFPACGFRRLSVSNDNELQRIVGDFQSEFESKKNECAVLIINSTSTPDKWTIAGFNNEELFSSKLIDNHDIELSEELKKKPADECKVVKLVIDELGVVGSGSFEIGYSSGQPPLFIKIGQVERQMGRLNRAFSDYASLLVMLAGSEVVNQETFDNLAKDLNGNIIDTANQLEKQGVKIPDNINQGIGIFSIVAAEGFRAYIENKRRESLKEAIEENLKVLEHWSEVAKNALKNIRLDIKHEYKRKDRIQKMILATETDSDVKRQAAQDLIRLNASLFDIMGVLKELDKAYSKMPAAHADLAESLGNEEFSLPDLKKYYDHARHLQSLYKSITQQPTS